MNDVQRRVQQLESLRAAILELDEVRNQGAGVVELDQTRTGRLSRIDALQRQAIAQHGQRQAQEQLRRIDAALRRCRDGSYGRCFKCDEPISEKRLDIDPAADLCIACAQARDP